jgi:hypothetical protein
MTNENTGYAMQAFVRGGRAGVDAVVAEIDGLGAEAADTFNEEPATAIAGESGHAVKIVEAAGGCFVMDHRDMRDIATGDDLPSHIEIDGASPVLL